MASDFVKGEKVRAVLYDETSTEEGLVSRNRPFIIQAEELYNELLKNHENKIPLLLYGTGFSILIEDVLASRFSDPINDKVRIKIEVKGVLV